MLLFVCLFIYLFICHVHIYHVQGDWLIKTVLLRSFDSVQQTGRPLKKWTVC